jgi:hypothetical protein
MAQGLRQAQPVEREQADRGMAGGRPSPATTRRARCRQRVTRAEDELRHHPQLTHHLHYDQAALYRRLGARDVSAERAAGGAPITPFCVWLRLRLRAGALAASGDPRGAEAAFRKAERVVNRNPLFRAIARRLAAGAALEHPSGIR